MPKNISKELEKEILSLPTKEKDRHLLRLIAANKLLREQMQFNLLEDESDLQWRREEISEENKAHLMVRYPNVVFLTKAIKKRSAAITWHRRVTKDKYGEVQLWIHWFELLLENQSSYINATSRKSDVLRLYLVKRARHLIKLTEALHEDYRIDFLAGINRILKLLHTFETKYMAASQKLPVEFE